MSAENDPKQSDPQPDYTVPVDPMDEMQCEACQ